MNDSQAAQAPSRGLSLRVKASLLFAALALAPALVVGLLLAEANRDAVETSERSTQAAVLKEVSGETLRLVGAIQDDAMAVASALGVASKNLGSTPDPLASVKALLATRRTITSARFEVPAAKVNTLLNVKGKGGGGRVVTESSTEALRSVADQRGAAFELRKGDVGVIVVPVASEGPRGYLTVQADLRPLREELETIAKTRFEKNSVGLVVADSNRRTVAAFGLVALQAGDDASNLPVWQALPAGATWTSRVAVISSFDADGTPMLGGVETVPALGWATAIFRPEAEAYQALSGLRRKGILVAAVSTFVALILGVWVARGVTQPVLRSVRQAQLVGQRQWNRLERPTERGDELGTLERSISHMAEELQSGEREMKHQAQIRADLSRFMNHELVDQIVEGKHDLALGGRRAEVSILFADVVAFTPLAEKRPAEEVVGLLNELFSVLSEVVFRHNGTVDKFIGDCIMAVWGAPLEQADHRESALSAAEDMMRLLETLNADWIDRFGVEVRLAIGINSGEAIVGNIGSNKRMEYTVIGDVVNVAARLEAVAAPNQILVAADTAEKVGDGFVLTSLGERNLTGRATPTQLFQLEYEV